MKRMMLGGWVDGKRRCHRNVQGDRNGVAVAVMDVNGSRVDPISLGRGGEGRTSPHPTPKI